MRNVMRNIWVISLLPFPLATRFDKTAGLGSINASPFWFIDVVILFPFSVIFITVGGSNTFISSPGVV